MEQIHSLLKRQLKRCFGDNFQIPDKWQGFISAVNDAYWESDVDREMLERSLDLSSQELVQANSEMRAIFQAIPDLLFRIDSQGKILDYKAGLKTDFLIQPNELLGKLIQDIPTEYIGEQFRYAMNQVQEEKSIVRIEYSRMLQCQEHFYEARLVPMPEDEIVVIIRDITERKQADDAIRKSEERYRTIFESTATANIIVAEDSTIVMANNNFVNLSGYTKQELEGKTCWTAFIHKDDVDKMRNYHTMRRINPRSAPHSYEFRSISRNGEALNLFMSVAMIPETKESIVSLIDLTERKNLETQLIQAQKMEAIGTLAGGIAHDFNNILMGIQGCASLMLLETSRSHPHCDRLKLIEDQVIKAADLTKQLLGFARGGKYEAKPVNINDLIEETSTMFGRTKKEIAIHSKYEKDIWVMEADRGQIEQVFLNLYLNAGQAMPAGGDLSLETNNVIANEVYAKTYSMATGRYVRISVSDTGVGMDEKTKGRIFEPFFTTKELGRGTGLGLAMVYGIVKNHNGFIHVVSEPDKGTTFIIHFPASNKNVVQDNPAVQNILRGEETILLVDDEPRVLWVNKAMLEALGYKVYEVKNGEEAIALYKEKKDEVDLVVLDMIMPGLSGGETYNHISALNPAAKVILCSGYSLDGQAQQIMDKGCQGFIQKPFNVADISKKIREILSQGNGRG